MKLAVVAGLTLLFQSTLALAANWSETELHIQHGQLNQPFAAQSNTDIDTTIFTLQHASGWDYGSQFFFFDYARTADGDELYGEWYPFFSSKQILGSQYSGPIQDIGLVLGVNAAPDAEVVKYLPGVQVNWAVPGFSFFNTLLTAYIDDSKGLAGNGAPQEGNSAMVDVAWRLPLNVQQQRFSIEGHAEYIRERSSELPGVRVKDWVLAQIQLRWDLGQALWAKQGQVFVGVEYQYWNNKLGTNEDESAVQLLGVWRF